MVAKFSQNISALGLSRHKKWIFLFPVLVFSLLTNYLQINDIFNPINFGVLDASWFLEMTQQLQQGNVLGRDVFFTYGPLSQWIAWLGVQLQGSTALNGFALGQFIMVELSLVCLYLIICITQQLDWPEGLFVFATIYVFSIFLVRPFSGLLAVCILIRALGQRSPQRYWVAALSGIVCFISQLLSIDFGLFALAASGGLIAFWLIASFILQYRRHDLNGLQPPIEYLKIGFVALATFAALNAAMLVYFHFSSPTYHWLDYWRYNLAALGRYNYAMASDWLTDNLIQGPLLTIITLLMLLYTLYFAVRKIRDGFRKEVATPAYAISGLLIFMGINLKSALTRSDSGHFLYGVVGLAFLFSMAVVLSRASKPMLVTGMILLAQAISLWPFSGANYVQAWPALIGHPELVVEQWQLILARRVDPQAFIPEDLAKNVDPQKLIVSFPYNNIVPIAMGRKTLAPVIQGYAAFDTTLQYLYIQQMQTHLADLEVLYGLDESSPALSNVQNITRLPIIFEYLARNFTLKVPQVFKGYLVLKPRDTILPLQRFPMAFQQSPGADESVAVDLSESKACNLIEIQLEIGYPIYTLLGRPNDLTLRVMDGDKVVRHPSLVGIETGKPFSTFVYLGKSEDFGYIFNLDRNNPLKPIQFNKLVLSPGPVSLFDVQPNAINVLNLNCIN